MMKKVLVIEDEKNLARFVELELKHEGMEPEVCYDGRSGLEAALDKDKKFDLILLDLMLPELNGLDVARRIRQHSNIPIIMMTARDSTIDQVSGFDGVLFYAVKDNKLFIYTFDSKAPGHIFTNELNVDGIISYKLLGRSICQSIRSKILPSSP